MSPALTPPRVALRAPMRVRFFHERSLDALEGQINEWLAERPDREIVEIRQSVAIDAGRGMVDRELIVSVWYIED